MFSFFEECHTVFHRGTILHFHLQRPRKGSNFSTSSPTLVILCVCVCERERKERQRQRSKKDDFVARIKKLCQKRWTGLTYQGQNMVWAKRSQSFVEQPNVINCIWRALDFCTNFSTRSNWKCYSHSQGHSKSRAVD